MNPPIPPPKVYRLSAQSKGEQEVRVPEFPCWLFHNETGEALPYGWTLRQSGPFSESANFAMGFTHWAPNGPRPTAAPDTTTTEGDECGPIREGEGLRTPPTMTTASKNPYSQDCLELCWQIEKCGASEELTKASVMASALLQRLTPKADPEAVIAAVFAKPASVEGETMKLELVAPRTEDEMRKHGQSYDTLIGHEKWMIEWATTLEKENTELRRKVGELEGDKARLEGALRNDILETISKAIIEARHLQDNTDPLVDEILSPLCYRIRAQLNPPTT